MAESRQSILDAGEQLTVFTENLNVVGMTAAQATAMKTASDGENALTSDTSASKALLQAIMNSIRGEDSNVGGRYSDLNSINISFDTSSAFDVSDATQAAANYNGQDLYSAVYPQCRNAVRNDCSDAALQRAITAYLMAIEQDCNTVETAIVQKQKQTKAAIREGSAMLDLARVENRQKHNSDDIATCLANVEQAILSEEVCGANYHKCLDNGEFIDITTGTPIAGVVDFYKLETILTFPAGVDASDQKLTSVFSNRTFVQNFEKRVKKFAEPALDKCTEQATDVWADYLDKAMLDIYYAQKAKVSEIKQGCFDFVSACYMNGDKSITAAMTELTGDSTVLLQPHKIDLTDQLCKNYVESCDNMFGGNIIQDYIANRTNEDTLTACRAVAKQCFDKYGGTNYQNFYYPYSGLFTAGQASDWFTLYEWTEDPTDGVKTENGTPIKDERGIGNNRTITLYPKYKSECAKQLTTIDACNKTDIIEQAFGGLDMYYGKKYAGKINNKIYQVAELCQGQADCEAGGTPIYGYNYKTGQTVTGVETGITYTSQPLLNHRNLRPTGVATEIYNQIIDALNTQCNNLLGRFVEYQNINIASYSKDNICLIKNNGKSAYATIKGQYGIGSNENMCPRDYDLSVDTKSWGACLCWENGGRRSKWGKSAQCVPILPTATEYENDGQCPGNITPVTATANTPTQKWCSVTPKQATNQVCPNGSCSEEVPKGL